MGRRKKGRRTKGRRKNLRFLATQRLYFWLLEWEDRGGDDDLCKYTRIRNTFNEILILLYTNKEYTWGSKSLK